MSISDILRHKQTGDGPAVVTIAPSATVVQLAALLAEHRIGAVVVLDDGSTGIAGIVSERDIVRSLATNGAGGLDVAVSQIMTTTVVTCAVDDTVEQVAETMTARRIRHMPVLEGGELVGVVSIGDIVSSRIRQLELDRGQLEQYIAG